MSKIPRIIHLCWLSGEPYPELIDKCIETWKKVMPDYSIMLWDKQRFNSEIDNRFAREALEQKKWAFVADYIRLYALYTYGGIYLDSDVRVYKRFDSFLEHSFFSCIEYFKPTNYVAIEAAIMGSIAGHPFVERCLNIFDNITFIKKDGTMDQTTITKRMAEIAATEWGFEYISKEQHLEDDIFIYPAITFTNPSGDFSKTKTYAIHLCNGSWIDKKSSFGQRLIGFAKLYWSKPYIAIENIYKKIKSILLQ